MLAALFTLFVLASLASSTLIASGTLPGKPGSIIAIIAVHMLFLFFFLRAYRRFRAIHRLVVEGRGELYDVAMARIVARERFRELRDHYRLRRCQGLVLTGQALAALDALEQLREHVKPSRWVRLAALEVEAEANLQLGQLFWTERALTLASGIRRADRHKGLRAVRARTSFAKGDAETAAEGLRQLVSVREFPYTRAYRARNLLWYGEALLALGRAEEAARALRLAVRAAPDSYYAQLASAATAGRT